MLLVLTSCLLWWPLLIGLGAPLFGLLSRPPSNYSPATRLTLCSLFGLLTLALLGTLANFLTPTYPVLPCLAATLGLASLLLHRRDLFRDLRPFDAIVAFFVLALFSLFATQSPTHVDTALYHLQSVRWITDSRIVPGLANLHLRLGYNSAWAMTAAMLEAPGLVGRSTFLLNTLLGAITACLILDAARRIATERLTISDGLLVLLTYPLIDMAVAKGTTPLPLANIPSLGNDFPAMILTVLTLALLTRQTESDRADLTTGLHATALAVFAFMIKISTAPLLAGTLLVLAYRARRSPASRLHVFTSSSLLLLFLLPWLARGVVLSGHPLYPTPVARIPVKWAVAPEDAARDLSWIRSWARDGKRSPEQVAADSTWLRRWSTKTFNTHGARVAPALVLAGLAAMTYGLAKRQLHLAPGRAWAALAIAAIGVVYWFVMAPDPRFGYGFIAAFTSLTLLTGLTVAGCRADSLYLRGVLLLLPIPTFLTPPMLLRRPAAEPLVIPRVDLKQVLTPEGVAINVPTADAHARASPLHLERPSHAARQSQFHRPNHHVLERAQQ